ncbi:MAG: hypothetical protein LH647_08820, partial [Leptolyngbyaceae cyanobacterium CAN_BIN12]|nr:hypothetical protein [Leptolyngbyaceae cyanobacterium CAN_BIN12]
RRSPFGCGRRYWPQISDRKRKNPLSKNTFLDNNLSKVAQDQAPPFLFLLQESLPSTSATLSIES